MDFVHKVVGRPFSRWYGARRLYIPACSNFFESIGTPNVQIGKNASSEIDGSGVRVLFRFRKIVNFAFLWHACKSSVDCVGGGRKMDIEVDLYVSTISTTKTVFEAHGR